MIEKVVCCGNIFVQLSENHQGYKYCGWSAASSLPAIHFKSELSPLQPRGHRESVSNLEHLPHACTLACSVVRSPV